VTYVFCFLQRQEARKTGCHACCSWHATAWESSALDAGRQSIESTALESSAVEYSPLLSPNNVWPETKAVFGLTSKSTSDVKKAERQSKRRGRTQNCFLNNYSRVVHFL